MKRIYLVLSIAIGFSVFAKVEEKSSFLVIQNDVSEIVSKELQKKFTVAKTKNGHKVIEVTEKNVLEISEAIHHTYNKCGGFYNFDSKKEAIAYLSEVNEPTKRKKYNQKRKDFLNSLNLKTKHKKIQTLVDKVEETPIREMIEKLSSYHNRFYQSKTGVEAAKFIAKTWKNIIKDREDAEVVLYDHSWKQPSVILKIEGKSKDAIVLGGHLDSINGFTYQMSFGRKGGHAPGADDNASGIATITEILRVFIESDIKPQKTIFFMGYAAEEVGLKGSKDIAKAFTKSGAEYSILTALQFDMTNFNGSDEKMFLIGDNTSEKLNAYLGSLIDRYVHVEWSKTNCGYACSDHASWNNAGVPAAFPFEAAKKDMNKDIHTSGDTIDKSKGTADHAENFAKLGVAYLLDLNRK